MFAICSGVMSLMLKWSIRANLGPEKNVTPKLAVCHLPCAIR